MGGSITESYESSPHFHVYRVHCVRTFEIVHDQADLTLPRLKDPHDVLALFVLQLKESPLQDTHDP